MLENIGIDPKLLIAQIINFGIVLFVLYRFLYKPLLKRIDSRNEKIEKGVKHAEEMEERREEMEKRLQDKEKEAERKSFEAIEKAQKEAEKIKSQSKEEAQKEADELVKKTKKQIRQEKDKIIEEVKEDIIEIVEVASRNSIGSAKTGISKNIIKESVDEAAKSKGKK